ncbi:hypothetical protein N9E28_00960 [Alphaproteobacteria bacterium]|nr:hypothetical protein [Alphaproteobacteria bacterium]
MIASFKHAIFTVIETVAIIGAWIRSPHLVAFAFRLAIREKKNLSSSGHNKPRLIVLSKPGGLEDVLETFIKKPESYSLALLSRKMIFGVSSQFLGKGINDWEYWDCSSANENKNDEYKAFLKSVLTILKKKGLISGFIQFNVIYIAERQLARACAELNLIFITLHKECMYSTAAAVEAAIMIKNRVGKYHGTKFIVYNRRLADALVTVEFLRRDQVAVTGCPRLDRCHKGRLSNLPKQKLILMFAIQPDAGVYHLNYEKSQDNLCSTLPGKNIRKLWETFIPKVNSTFIDVAVKNPDKVFLIKTKPGHDVVQKASFTKNLPPNLSILSSGDSRALIESSAVVVAFNSTVVLEAVAFGVPTIVPHIFDESDRVAEKYIHETGSAVMYAKSTLELEEMILQGFEAHRELNLTKDATLVLDDLIGNPDGDSSNRFRAELDKICKNK